MLSTELAPELPVSAELLCAGPVRMGGSGAVSPSCLRMQAQLPAPCPRALALVPLALRPEVGEPHGRELAGLVAARRRGWLEPGFPREEGGCPGGSGQHGGFGGLGAPWWWLRAQ